MNNTEQEDYTPPERPQESWAHQAVMRTAEALPVTDGVDIEEDESAPPTLQDARQQAAIGKNDKRRAAPKTQAAGRQPAAASGRARRAP